MFHHIFHNSRLNRRHDTSEQAYKTYRPLMNLPVIDKPCVRLNAVTKAWHGEPSVPALSCQNEDQPHLRIILAQSDSGVDHRTGCNRVYASRLVLDG